MHVSQGHHRPLVCGIIASGQRARLPTVRAPGTASQPAGFGGETLDSREIRSESVYFVPALLYCRTAQTNNNKSRCSEDDRLRGCSATLMHQMLCNNILPFQVQRWRLKFAWYQHPICFGVGAISQPHTETHTLSAMVAKKRAGRTGLSFRAYHSANAKYHSGLADHHFPLSRAYAS